MRSFKLILFILGAGYFLCCSNTETLENSKTKPMISITMDDPNTYRTPLLDWETRNNKILQALKDHNLQAALFVCGSRVNDEKGLQVLKSWDKGGHIIGNHSFSHLYFNSSEVSLEKYEKDFLKGDSLINQFSNYERLFRFPFLKEGDTQKRRDGFRKILKINNYKIGHVSIDASDWYVDQRLKERLEKEPDADIAPYKEYYLQHIFDRATFYNKLAEDLLGRHIKHTLLIHHNLLNALFLDDLINMFKEKGWEFINASEAYQDEIYNKFPNTLPAGESIIWALAKESCKYDSLLRYPGGDERYEKDKMDQLGL